MKFKLISLSLFISIIGGCKELPRIKAETPIARNVDSNFETFLSLFNKDSLFQVSRIVFPLKVKELELGDPSEMLDKSINKEEHRKLDFSLPEFKDSIDNYTQNIRLEKNNATIEIRGVDNGIIMDVFFEKKNGKWMLISWTDSST